MAATSKHYGDIALWIEKVINSSETRQQCVNARKLLYNFEFMLDRDVKLDYYAKKDLLMNAEIAYHVKLNSTSLK